MSGKYEPILFIIIGVGLILSRRHFAKWIFRQQMIRSKKGGNVKQVRAIETAKDNKAIFNTVEGIVVLAGLFAILMQIPRLYPPSYNIVRIILEFLFFSIFSIPIAGLIIGTLLRRIVFGESEKYMQKQRSLKVFVSGGNIGGISELADAEKNKNNNDPIFKAMQRRCLIKAIICFVVLYTIFMSSFFTLVHTVK